MKKTRLLAFLLVLPASLAFGCNTPIDQEEQTIPAFEELFAVNSYEELFKTYDNFYVKTVYTATEPAASFTEEILFFPGDGKVDFHMRQTKPGEDEYYNEVSRVGNTMYSRSVGYPLTAVLELGEEFLLDNMVPDLLSGQPVGKGYIENEQIVYHTSEIIEETEAYPAQRYDYTCYFNATTKLAEYVEAIEYDNKNRVVSTITTEFSYGVQVESIFATTLYDTVYNSDKRIHLEIIFKYGTDAQQSHSFVATTDASIIAMVDYSVHEFYTDATYTNKVLILNEYEGQTSLTLYAKPMFGGVDA